MKLIRDTKLFVMCVWMCVVVFLIFVFFLRDHKITNNS